MLPLSVLELEKNGVMTFLTSIFKTNLDFVCIFDFGINILSVSASIMRTKKNNFK